MEAIAPVHAGTVGQRASPSLASTPDRASARRNASAERRGSLFVRLSLTTVGLLALMAAVIVSVTFWTRSLAIRETGALARAGQLQSLAHRSRALGLAQDNITKVMLLEPEMMELAVAKIDAYDESQAVLARMDSLVPVELRRMTEQLHTLDAQQLRPLDTRILELMAASQLAEAKKLYFAEYEPKRVEYDRIVQGLASAADSAALVAERRVAESSRVGFQRIIVVLCIGIVLITLWVVRAGVQARAKLERVVSELEIVATGDLTRAVPVESRDEIGRIATALNGSVNTLRALVAGIQHTGQRLVGSSTHISTAATESAETVQQLDRAIDQISRGATLQAESIVNASAVVDDLSHTASSVQERASSLVTVSAEAVDVAHRGGSSVTAAIGELNELREGVRVTGRMMDGLQTQSVRIGEITQVISSVARQTNLLALNASIEAARAGEHGRGFAIIAEEVRKLSMSANGASEEISKLIGAIQSQVGDTAKTIEANTARLERGARLAQEAERGLTQILTAVERSDEQLRSIGESASHVANGAAKVRGIVLDIAAIAQENASAAEEMSAQSQQVTAAMSELAGERGRRASDSSAQALAAMARDLEAAVTRFTV